MQSYCFGFSSVMDGVALGVGDDDIDDKEARFHMQGSRFAGRFLGRAGMGYG